MATLEVVRLQGGPAAAPATMAVARLFRELRTTLVKLGVDIDLFQDFEGEIASLPGKYAEEAGGTLLLGLEHREDAVGVCKVDPITVVDCVTGAVVTGVPVACIALRALPSAGEGCAEVKRLFVNPHSRGRGCGAALTTRLMGIAAEKGYQRLVLDTLQRLPAALALYRSLGFTDYHAYCHNPMPDVVYLSKEIGGKQP